MDNTEEVMNSPEVCVSSTCVVIQKIVAHVNPICCYTIQVSALDLREDIDVVRNHGDLADAFELDKVVTAQLATEGDKFQQALEKKDREEMNLHAGRVIYLSKVEFLF